MASVTYVGTRKLADDVLGDNLVTNPYLVSATTGYTAQNTGSIARQLPGLLRVTNGASASSWASTPVTTESGKLYRVDVDVTLGTAPGTNIYASTTDSSASGALNIANATASGTVSLFFVATGTTTYLLLQNTGATTGQYNDYDNVRCREVLVRGHSTSIQFIINRLFSIAGSWTTGTGWSVGSGVATCDGTQTATSNLENPTLPSGYIIGGKQYDTSFVLSGYSAGTVAVNIGNTGNPEGTARSANGTYTQTITVLFGGAPTNFRMLADADFVGTVDTLSMTLAAGNTWAQDFGIQYGTYSSDRRFSRDSATSLDRSAIVYTYDGAEMFHTFTTKIQDYQAVPFMDEWLASVEDGTQFTFDLYGTADEPQSPITVTLESAGKQPAGVVGGRPAFRYQIMLREA